MKFHLVVVQPFADYKKGDHITDPAAVAKYLETHHTSVVKILAPADDEHEPT